MALIDVIWDVLLVVLDSQQDFTSRRVGARPGHPISGHRTVKIEDLVGELFISHTPLVAPG